MVEKVGSYATRKTIMIGQDSYYIALPCVVSGTANETILAGTPLTGDLTDRDAGFQAATGAMKCAGMLLHDVKLDNVGEGNGTIVLAGCVDLLKLDPSVVTLLNQAEGLDNIIKVKGSAI